MREHDTYVFQFTGGPLDGAKFLSAMSFDEITLTRADGEKATITYECDWTREGEEHRMTGSKLKTIGTAKLLNFVPK